MFIKMPPLELTGKHQFLLKGNPTPQKAVLTKIHSAFISSPLTGFMTMFEWQSVLRKALGVH